MQQQLFGNKEIPYPQQLPKSNTGIETDDETEPSFEKFINTGVTEETLLKEIEN